MPVFVARNSFWRMLLLFAGALAFVALGVWLAGLLGEPPEPDKVWVGWLSIAFFGLCAVGIVPQMFDREDSLEISSLGIRSRKWSQETIPWSEITQVTVWEFRRNRSIILHLRDPQRFPSTGMLGKLAGANKMLTGGDVAISLSGMDRTTDQAIAAIRQWTPDKVRA